MLRLIIPARELWDEKKEIFIKEKEQILNLEHSLVSISKWESKWNKPFISNKDKTYDEIIDYIKCMTLTQNVDEKIYERITDANIKSINEYIDLPMTATWFSNDDSKKIAKNNRPITNELIYYLMISFGIPSEYQKWHLNRLLTLIKVCEEENKPQKKMSTKEIINRNRILNEERKKRFNTSG